MLPFHHRCVEEFIPTAPNVGLGGSGAGADAFPGGLMVMGRGLGEWRVLVQMLRICCVPKDKSDPRQSRPLILVLNGMSEFAGWCDLCEWWGNVPKADLPRAINATTLSSKRALLYREGGCFFITTRVILSDLLHGVPFEHNNIAGVLVLKAHVVTEQSNEAFAIRLIKLKYPRAFVRAFSDSPEKLSIGFGRLQSTMHALYVRKLFLFPRFRQEVRDDLDEKAKVKVVEIAQPLSDAMREIQSALVESVKLCVEEIRKSASLDVSDLTVETALFRHFDHIIRSKLLQDWGSVSFKTRQLIDDLQTLQGLLKDLLTLDCVSFYEKLMDCRRKSTESTQPSIWLFTDAADRLFRQAKSRLYRVEDNSKKLNVVLEPMLKLEALKVVLSEIETFQREKGAETLRETLGGTDVLILVKDETSLGQIANFLSEGSSPAISLIQKRFLNYLLKTIGTSPVTNAEQALLKDEMDRLKSVRDSMPLNVPVRRDDEHFHPSTCFVRGVDQPVLIERKKHVAIHLSSDVYVHGLLDALTPRFIILYDADLAAMREAECYCATHSRDLATNPCSLYLVYYENSVEEQRHLSSLNQERDSFLRLIEDKSELVFGPSVVPGDAGTKQDDFPEMVYDASSGHMVPATKKRRGGLGAHHQNKVVVDLRELRSFLPNMLHTNGFILDPRTLEVGDYVLSPETCVERKAIPDLIDSLKSGRLFKQCTMMQRHYKRPILLIEFPDSGPFRLVSTDATEMTQVGVMSNLALLTCHFPDLRVVWSKSLRATVDLFRELQKNQQAPDGDKAESFEAESAGRIVNEVPNVEALEMLKRMPGVTKDNVYRIARGAASLSHLCTLSVEELAELCDGMTNARMLHAFLHERS